MPAAPHTSTLERWQLNASTPLPLLKISISWVIAGLLLTVATIILVRPMEGLLWRILVTGIALMIGGPVIHIGAAKLFFGGSNEYWWLIAAVILFIAVSAFFVFT